MADIRRRLKENAAGEFFVDAGCIDCSSCNYLAPEVFDAGAMASFVGRQPADDDARRRALMALIACPSGAIGTETKADLSGLRDVFPDEIADGVHYCGYHSEASYGAASYFIRRPAGNVLVDSPRFASRLVKRIEAMGGIELMVLSHRDDVADHARFAAHFGCRRVIHADDAVGSIRGAEWPIEGEDAVALDGELTLIPVPGHTRGSVCLLYKDRFLFTGDHLWWSEDAGQLRAGRGVCWYDWRKQTASMERLRDYDFEWVLPGHGQRHGMPAAAMRASLEDCIAWMHAR